MEIDVKSKRKGFENFVVCFHGPGFVGPIVGEYFVEYGDFRYIGSVKDKRIPPAAILINGKAYPTLRIYESKKNILFIVDQDIGKEMVYELFEKIMEFLREKRVKRIILINGIEDVRRNIYYISNTGERFERALELRDGVITGLPSLFLMQDEIPCIFLLAGTPEPNIDPQSALKVIEILSKEIGEKIDLTPLIKEIEEFMKVIGRKEIEKMKKTRIERYIYR